MLQAVLYDRLQQHARNERLERVLTNLFHDIEVVFSKSRHFDIKIIIDERKFFPEGHECLVLSQQASQDVTQLKDHLSRSIRIHSNQGRNGVQRIEQKMWIDLTGKRIH